MRKDPPYLVGPGWWPMLDEHINRMKQFDPAADISIKEKYGCCRVDFVTERTEAFNGLSREQAAIEGLSVTICELCGQPGTRRTDRRWLQTLCDRCAECNQAELRKVYLETEGKYHASRLISQEEADRVLGITPEDYADISGVDFDED